MPMNPRLLRPLALPRLLDFAPGAAAAYSLRQLSSSYAGPVVTVRRSSDSAEADFTAGQVSDGTLAAWVGSGNDGFVKTWHDQSGNNRDATQATSADQPKIVSSGAIVTEAGRASVDFDGTSDFLDIATVTTLGIPAVSDPHSIVCVFRGDQVSGNTSISSNYGSLGVNVVGFESTKIVNLRAGTASTNLATASQDTDLHFGVHLYSGGSATRTFSGYRDGVVLPTAPVTGIFSDTGSFESGSALRLGRWGTLSLFFDGRISEYIVFPSDQSANRQRIERDINRHYRIF